MTVHTQQFKFGSICVFTCQLFILVPGDFPKQQKAEVHFEGDARPLQGTHHGNVAWNPHDTEWTWNLCTQSAEVGVNPQAGWCEAVVLPTGPLLTPLWSYGT